MPTSGHFIFIPAIFLIGALFGYVMANRASADRAAMEARREELRKEAREERAARKAKRAAESE
ncbi:MAG: hypothetical protein GY811_13470 [Myxococcales bacterium]|nr:hypothetical protein [Myxococcales bacterium]